MGDRQKAISFPITKVDDNVRTFCHEQKCHQSSAFIFRDFHICYFFWSRPDKRRSS